MTADYIAFHATQRPEAVAFHDNDRTITYAQAASDIRKFTRGMREFGIPAGGRVAIGCENPYLHLLLLMASERLDLTTVSLVGHEEPLGLGFLDRFDLVLAPAPLPPVRPRRLVELTQAWVHDVLRLPDAEEALPPRAEGPLRILRTSGTTGLSKRLYLTRRMLDAWTQRWIWCYGLGPRTRALVALPFIIGGSYAQICACLRAGATLVYDSRVEVPETLRRHAITHMTLLPIYLRNVLDQIPAGYGRLPELVISTFGGAIAPGLRAQAVERLCGAVSDMYGCNEIGFIASNGLHRVNEYLDIWPGVAVEAVDDADRPLPPGQTGRLRVRTESMFSGYIDDPETTRRMLRDGWFYPGDAGALRESGSLELLGRADDLLNFGGQKIPPEALEELLRASCSLKEVAVDLVADAEGRMELRIAVADPGVTVAELGPKIDAVLLRTGIRKFAIVPLPRIPRNLAGKIQRHILRAEIAAPQRRAEPPRQ